ncbi:histone-lysine N-methyltransferase, H3 lysine-79 specific [Coniochaeta ligniaria NRRL 30616]|uniref:Histone-lysine N-methyltransferase, H3 lysine-79 specific n=1 Tax=Coniochaeta ligniaria NRRL 30616 TaxID=1408157 RepID=A0A1J7J1Z1_9PEZI|nr:histone-lysine N-methyltransferase, H3 lysine-79 specific [Coniochaeta ligniaria NRRL 30616]
MGALNQKSKFKPPAPTIRVQRVPIEKPKQLKPKPSPANSNYNLLQQQRAKPQSKAASPYPGSSSADESRRTKRKAPGGGNSRSPSVVKFDSDDTDGGEDGDNDVFLGARRKKRRLARVDPNRKLRHSKIWTGAVDEKEKGKERDPSIIHAADLANLKSKCQPALRMPEEEVGVELRYPGGRGRERYELVYGKDKIDAVKDITTVVKFVAENYLNDEDAQPFLEPSTGLIRQLQKSTNVNDGQAFKAAVKDYNKRLFALQKDGTIAKHLDSISSFPSDLVAFILDQVYDRTVAPKVELLLKYENGSDNVYGELLHPFITDILVEKTRMKSEQVFVDLGSGVGNVVLQAALEIGCESWGCEMMENACDLADAQLREFQARCQLWGVAPGKVQLDRGDFRTNERILEVLRRADVVLVNNQAFTSQLNDSLVSMFLDLKSGCKIVSLKSFVHEHKSASNDVAMSILDVEDLTYPSDYVSWTHQGGTYCISTKK